MSLCKNGEIQNCCHPNALMTLKEYLVDYASPETRKIGEQLIAQETGNIPRKLVHDRVLQYLGEIEQGARDFRLIERGNSWFPILTPCSFCRYRESSGSLSFFIFI